MTDFAKVCDVRVGSRVKVDGGFACIPKGTEYVVSSDKDGFYIQCSEGRHYLSGQLDWITGSYYVGVHLLSSNHP